MGAASCREKLSMDSISHPPENSSAERAVKPDEQRPPADGVITYEAFLRSR